MVMGSFCVAQRYQLNEQIWRICRILGKGVLVVEELSTGRIQEVKLADLLVEWKEGRLTIGGKSVDAEKTPLAGSIEASYLDAFRQSYTEEEQHVAKVKLAYVNGLHKLPRSDQVMTPVIDDIWAKHMRDGIDLFGTAPHFTTVANWIRVYQDAGNDIRALVNRERGKGNRSPRIHPDVEEMVEDLIKTRFLTPERVPASSLRKELKGMVALKNAMRLAGEKLLAPSYEYIKRKIREIPAYDICRARYGKRVADLKFRTAGAGVVTSRPLERASMDHTRMDVFVIDERTCLPLGRPWLTLILDEHTRYVLGFYLSFEEPSNVSMARALRHALAPKEASKDVKAQWDAWGVMETLVVDNGMEFHGRTLENGAGRFGIAVQFCPRRKPWYKGKVERFFGTLNSSLLVDMKGKTFSSILLKGDYDPAKHAVMTLETLKRVMHIWVVDVYHQEVHSVLHMTPHQAWHEEVADVDRYLPPSSLAIDAAFSTHTTRRLTHKGIELDSLFYNSADLGVLRTQYGESFNVEVRMSDDDLGSIVVVAPDGRTLLNVPAVDIAYAKGLTRWQHNVCKRFQRRLQDDESAEISLLDAKVRIRGLIEADMGRTGSRKSTRSRQQRFIHTESEAAVSAEPVVLVVEPTPASEPARLDVSPSRPGDESLETDDIPMLQSRKRATGGVQ